GEPRRTRVGPEKHGRVGVAREERVERGLVAGAEQTELAHRTVGRGRGSWGTPQPENLERQAARQDSDPARITLAARHGAVDQDHENPGEPAGPLAPRQP